MKRNQKQLVKLIVGLGNPGEKYRLSRHNAGFRFVDALAKKYMLSFYSDKKFHAELCHYQSDSTDYWLCKPQTYMNNSGIVVQSMINFHKLAVNELLVAHDDIDLATGITRLKNGGGHGGHNGLRNIIQCISNNAFLRLRIGVGHPGSKDKVTAYVLSPGSVKEETAITHALTLALDKSDLFFQNKLNQLMTEINSNPQANQPY